MMKNKAILMKCIKSEWKTARWLQKSRNETIKLKHSKSSTMSW